jgi:hypothetical protein
MGNAGIPQVAVWYQRVAALKAFIPGVHTGLLFWAAIRSIRAPSIAQGMRSYATLRALTMALLSRTAAAWSRVGSPAVITGLEVHGAFS